MLVTPAQAQIVTLASQLGTIRLILRSGEDSEQPKTVAMTAHEMLGAYGGGDRAKENPIEAEREAFQGVGRDDLGRRLRENAKAARQATAAPKSRNALPCGSARARRSATSCLTNNSGVQGLPGDEGTWTATGMGPSRSGKPSADTRGHQADGRRTGGSAAAGARPSPQPTLRCRLPSPASRRSPADADKESR